MFICHFGISKCHPKICTWRFDYRENFKSIKYGIVDGVEGTIKMTENEVYGVSLEAVQKSEESIVLKQNQQGSEDILVKPNAVYGVSLIK